MRGVARPLRTGDPVVYRPHPNTKPEDGVVTGLSADGSMVFVRYSDQHPGAPGKATPVAMLTLLDADTTREGRGER